MGRKRQNYKPDFALTVDGVTRWVVDAKAPTEDPQDWLDQCASYCLLLNRKGARANVFLVTNGVRTLVYPYNGPEPRIELGFEDFEDGNPSFERFRRMMGRPAMEGAALGAPRGSIMTLRRPSTAEITSVFAAANDYIYKNDNISPAAAFQEFVKLIFVKIWCDRELHERYPEEMQKETAVPSEAVRFSTRWLDSVEAGDRSPVDVLLFQELAARLEVEIARGSKKRIFDAGERIRLLPETVRGVVSRLERYDLFGIDEDLNGRLFESFLNSTMRGEELGQYFTPRSIVKLMTRLSDLRAGTKHVDRVIDACCGTGGFLIEALARMMEDVAGNAALTRSDKRQLLDRIRSNSIFGLDAGREPVIARIARINMYLHGDGGSRIYIGDALDKKVDPPRGEDPEVAREIEELQKLLVHGGFRFDVVLTNPPFAKEYNPANTAHSRILEDYDLWKEKVAGRKKVIRSSVLFLERYRDLLAPGGRLLTIIDDNILGGKEYEPIRRFIRRHFLIRAVISLPGDAFQRSKARVKTSILYLVRRTASDEPQPAAFMYYTRSVGVDDTARKRVLPQDAVRHRLAVEETEEVLRAFRSFEQGATEWAVAGADLKDRMDVKFHLLHPGRRVGEWEAAGREVVTVGSLVRPRTERISKRLSKADDEELQLFKVEYSGQPVRTERRRIEDMTYSSLTIVTEGDIVISHINAVNGAICVVPKELDGAAVSPEYTVLEPLPDTDPRVLVALLRSPEIRVDILSRSSGIGRHRVEWPQLAQLTIPLPDTDLASAGRRGFLKSEELLRQAAVLRKEATEAIEQGLGLESEYATEVLEAFKPPK